MDSDLKIITQGSCKALNIKLPYTVDELCSLTVELLKKNGFKTTTYVRPIAYKGAESIGPRINDDDDRLVIYCCPMGSYSGKQELKTMVTSWGRVEDNMIPPRTKPIAAYLNSALASLEATNAGYDEAIFMTRDGHICEGPGENIFIVKKGKLITPPPEDNILEGITRETVMLLAKEELGVEVLERSVTRTELYASDEIFFSGTAMEVTPVVEVDNRTVGDGHEGEICRKIKGLFFDIATGKNKKYVHFCTPIY